MATVQDVLEEFHPYYVIHTKDESGVNENPPISEQACLAYQELQQGKPDRARQILQTWAEQDKKELPADWQPPEDLLKRQISLEDVFKATSQEEAKRLNAVRRQQLLAALS